MENLFYHFLLGGVLGTPSVPSRSAPRASSPTTECPAKRVVVVAPFPGAVGPCLPGRTCPGPTPCPARPQLLHRHGAIQSCPRYASHAIPSTPTLPSAARLHPPPLALLPLTASSFVHTPGGNSLRHIQYPPRNSLSTLFVPPSIPLCTARPGWVLLVLPGSSPFEPGSPPRPRPRRAPVLLLFRPTLCW